VVTELTDEEEFLQRSLADLEAERDAGDIDEADYELLKGRYTSRYEAVERELRSPAVSVVEAAPPPPRSYKVPVAVAVIVALAGLSGWAVMSSSGDRTQGETITGATTLTTSPTQAKLAQARQYIEDKKVLDAIKTYDAVLKDDPKQPEALAYRGWLLHLAGVDQPALESLTKAVQSDPSYPDAHFFRGEVLCKFSHDQAGAVAEYQTYLDSGPPEEMVSMVSAQLRSAQAGACGNEKVDFGAPPPGAATPTVPTTLAP
jgi:tetratricopeptide (TPR) repeat protein